jgi:ABC-type transport system involved in multi-copper enzyme maturation permease subunit
MLKSLAIKELRESARAIAVAAVAVAYALTQLMGIRLNAFPFDTAPPPGFPFVYDQFTFAFVLVIGAFAIVLGLKQSAVESWRGTYYFLLHQPASRRSIFGTKMLVGAACVLVVGGLLISIYALWAATPGNVPAPFFWSMTASAWQLWLSMLLVYLGAFLSGIRPARWFGTRLIPLVAACMMAFLAATLPWLWLTAVTVAVCAALITVSIFYYANNRDF